MTLDWAGVEWSDHLHTVRAGGVTLRYVDLGDGPVVLLLHGMAGSWESWLTNILPLSESYRVVAVDLPGFGGSAPLTRAASFAEYSVVLTDLLDELGVDSAAVVGHSLGGLVALSLADAQPFRVRCLVLVSGGGAALSAVRLAFIRIAFLVLRVAYVVPGLPRMLARPRVARALIRMAVHAPVRVPHDLVLRMLPTAVGPGFMDAVRLGSAYLKDSFDARRIAVPTLLVWGREDRILPVAMGRRLARDLQSADLAVVDDVGHCAMFEGSDGFNELALEFLSSQRSDGTSGAVGRASAQSWIASPAAGAGVGEVS